MPHPKNAYTLSLHDALPISEVRRAHGPGAHAAGDEARIAGPEKQPRTARRPRSYEPRREEDRSEEHTSELQSHVKLVCRLLLEKKKITKKCVLILHVPINFH